MVKVDLEGRITLPEDIREELGIRPGAEVDVKEADGTIVIVPENQPRKILDRMDRLVSEAEIEREIRGDGAERETREHEAISFDEISPQAEEFADDVRREVQQSDGTETDD